MEVVVVISFFAFCALNTVVEWLAPPSVPASQVWKWKKIGVSFLHSSLIGILCLYAFSVKPDMADDLEHGHSALALTILRISSGYFLYDAANLFRYQIDRESVEILCHHAVIMLCFTIGLALERFIAYGVFGLLIEVNTIFLHLRQLLHIAGVPKTSSIFRINSFTNIVTLCIFRLAVLVWMLRWAVIHYDDVGPTLFMCGVCTLSVLLGMSVVLLYRLVVSDLIPQNKDSSPPRQHDCPMPVLR